MVSGPAVGAGAAAGVELAVVVVVVVVVLGVVVVPAGGAAVGDATKAGVSGLWADMVVSHTSPGSTAEISRRMRSQTSRLCRVALSVAMRRLRSDASAAFASGVWAGF